MKKISIFGAGGWGTTLAVILANKPDLTVTLWSPFKNEVAAIVKDAENRNFLAGIKIPASLTVTSDTAQALSSELLIFAIPSEYLRQTLRTIKKVNSDLEQKIILSVVKGIEIKSLKRPSEIIREELGLKPSNIVVLCGPNIAREIAKGLPAVSTAASSDIKSAAYVQKIFEHTPLRVYANTDVVGVEIAASLKNIIAIACGISDGLGFGTNTKSALICRGLKEMARFAKAYKVKEETLYGISGLGDLCTTCFSPLSRNRSVGEVIGKGKALGEVLNGMKMVAEGITTVKSVYKLSKKFKIDMPITKEVYRVLYENKPAARAVKDLMSRPLKTE
jgi:glycerol-3-phosphate dehydrogenase (NAD(P)+)